jgi:hypothetical protein
MFIDTSLLIIVCISAPSDHPKRQHSITENGGI